MFVLENCTKVLRSDTQTTVVLDAVNVTIPSDGMTVVLGLNGAGKSTLLGLLSGALMPTTGSLHHDCSVSFPVGTFGGVHPKQKGRELVRYVASLYGHAPDEIIRFIESVDGLGDALNEKFIEMPRQARMRLAYILGYALTFDVYLFDTSPVVGDSEFQTLCMTLLNERRRQAGVILTTQSLRYAREMADRVMIIDKGKIFDFDDKKTAIEAFGALQRAGAS